MLSETLATVPNMVDKLTEQKDEKHKLSNEVTNVDQTKKDAHLSKTMTCEENTKPKTSPRKREDVKGIYPFKNIYTCSK